VRGDGLLEEPAVAAGVDEPREQLGIVAVARGLAQQPHDRPLRLADVRLQVRVELVRHGEAGVDLERATEGLFRAGLAVRRGLDVLADHAMAAAEVGPGGSEARIQLQAALVEVARPREPVVGPRHLVAPQVELVGARVVGRVREGRDAASPERKGERLDHAPGDVVLQVEEVAQRRLHRVRREQGASRCFDELGRGAELVTGAQ
jgi:hypothetical protein